ncbi:MAG: short-chain dehydrogenase [Rhodospirillaceae bacterium]|nr:short-chain dehydrogenase [Rhodospirillaceae bacterium]|tara:strand:+ start:62 stop:757 length:696 start_codon:yes stop_codon:yes gene_type:complete
MPVGTVLITGASRGIGLEFVRQYAADGWSVIACCRSPDKADDLKSLATKSDDVEVVALDVADHAAIDALARRLDGRAIDVLINNAGISGRRPQDFGSLDYADWQQVMETNLLAPVHMAEAFVDHVARGEHRLIANLSSVLGSIAHASGRQYLYRTSKAALNMAVKCMAEDLGPRGIRVVAFHPGHVRTDMGGASAPVVPTDSVRGMRAIMARIDDGMSGGFFNYDGSQLPW